MTTLAHTQNVEAEANTNFAGAKAKRVIFSSDARAITYVFAIIGVVTVAPFALLGQYFAPNVAKDLRHQSEMLSQAGDPAGAVVASRKAVDIYRGLMRASAVQYAPKLAASLHELSIRLNEAGDDTGALAAIREAVEMRRHLAKFSRTDAASLEQSLQLLTRIESAQRGELPAHEDRRECGAPDQPLSELPRESRLLRPCPPLPPASSPLEGVGGGVSNDTGGWHRQTSMASAGSVLCSSRAAGQCAKPPANS